jgi:hypothetical protein
MWPELAWKLPRITFARFIVAFVLYALWVGLTSWLVSMLLALTHPHGSFFRRLVFKPLELASAGVVYVIHAVGHALSYSVAHSMPAAAHWLNQLATRENALNNADANFAEQTARSFERLTEVWIPREIRTETAPLRHGIDHLERDLPRLRARLEHFRVGIDRLIRSNIMPRIRAHERAIDVTIPREIAGIRARERVLAREFRSPSRAFAKRLWKLGWIAVGAGLMVKFLVKKFPHLFCRNVTKMARSLCSPRNNLLVDLLLGEAVALFVLTDICTTVKAIEGVADRAAPLLQGLVTSSDDFFDWCGGDLPTRHDPPGYSGSLLPTAHD